MIVTVAPSAVTMGPPSGPSTDLIIGVSVGGPMSSFRLG